MGNRPLEVNSAERGKAQRVYEIYQDYRSQRSPWAIEAANSEDFFYGNQWTEAEIASLGEKGMAPLVVNRTMPVIMQEVALFASKNPTFRAVPRDDTDVAKAAFWTDVFDYIWYISNGSSEFLQCIQDYFVMGLGYMGAFIDPLADDGRGEVKVESIPVFDVYPDPNSRKIDLSDARSIIVSRRVDMETLMLMYPGKKLQLLAAEVELGPVADRESSNPKATGSLHTPDSYDYLASYTGSRGAKLRVIDCYERVLMPFIRVYYLESGVIDEMPEDQWDDGLEKNPAIYAEKFYKQQIKLTQAVGSTTILNEVILPCSKYPIVPFMLHHARTPYPIGDVAIIKGMQQEVNKRRSIMIHNASLSGNYRIMSQEGSIANEADYEKHGTRPGFNLKWRKGFEKPEAMLPQSLPNAFIQLEGEAKQDIEYAVSVFAHMMGSSTDAPETYRALLALEEAGQKKIQHKAKHARHALRQLGVVVLELAQALYHRPKLMRIVGEENEELRSVWLNKMAIDPISGEMQTINDSRVGRYDIVVTDSTAMPTNRMALLNLYMEMFQLGIIDNVEVLKKADVRDPEGVIQRMGEAQRLQSALAAKDEEVKQLAGLNQTLRRQSQQLEIHLGAQRGMEEIRDQVRQTTAEQKLIRARVGDALSNLNERLRVKEKELGVDAREILANLRLEREKQRALMEVRNARRSES